MTHRTSVITIATASRITIRTSQRTAYLGWGRGLCHGLIFRRLLRVGEWEPCDRGVPVLWVPASPAAHSSRTIMDPSQTRFHSAVGLHPFVLGEETNYLDGATRQSLPAASDTKCTHFPLIYR